MILVLQVVVESRRREDCEWNTGFHQRLREIVALDDFRLAFGLKIEDSDERAVRRKLVEESKRNDQLL